MWALLFAALSQTATALAQSIQQTVPVYPDHTKLLVVRDGTGRELPIGQECDWEVRRDHILAHFQEAAGPLPGAERRGRSKC